jgi:hypothetical protein
VPNNYAIQALAPAFDEEICPHWAERWEIRTHPLGCQVSTITSLTSIISIVSTLVFVLLVSLVVVAVKRVRRLNTQRPGWWKIWKMQFPRWMFRSGETVKDPGEEEPLLPS